MSVVAAATNGELDWTAILLALITAGAASFAAWQGRMNAKAISVNSQMVTENSAMVGENARLLHTNSGKTIGQHIEALQEEQMVLRSELQAIAREKLKSDAVLAAASLEAIAKLTAAADANMLETARSSASDLLAKADRTAHLLTPEGKNEPAAATADALMAEADRTAAGLAATKNPEKQTN